MNYKGPSKDELQAMQEFAETSSKLLEIILKYESNLALQCATVKINEAMMWFHSYVINGGKLSNESVN